MNKRNTILTIVIIVLVVLIALTSKKSVAPVTDSTTGATTEITTSGSTTKPNTSKGSVTTTPSSSGSLSRKEAQELYQDKLVRITDQCLPDKVTETFTLKKGERIMLDNDGTKAHSIIFAGTTYTINGQGYRTVTLPNDGMVSRTCDPKTGVTTVVVATAQ